MKLKPSKCHFGCEKIKILGHVVSAEGISPDPDKILAVSEFPIPKNVKDVQSFLGLANYYRKFVKSFADIARPLTLLTRKNVKFDWQADQQVAFDTLKNCLTKAPVLSHFRPDLPIELHTDASGYGIGAIILQTDESGSRPIAYASRRLSDLELKWNTSEKECLAVLYGVTTFRQYLWGKKFRVVVDHHALCWLQKNKDASGRLARWAIRLQDFDYEIVHKSGKKHLDADSLSRNPVSCSQNDDGDALEIPVYSVNFENITKLQRSDNKLRDLIYALENPTNADSKLLRQTRSYLLENNVLYKKHFDPRGSSKLLVIPDSMKEEILLCCHDDPLSGGHLGFAKTFGKIKTRYFWPNMYSEIENYVKSCTNCQHRKNVPKAPAGLLQPIKVGTPFEKLGIDILGPFPKTKLGNTVIVTAMCYATKWAIAKALPAGSAKHVADFLLEEVICKHGCFAQIISDRGKCFTSKLVTELVKGIGSYPTTTTAYHPKCNGLVEHYNGTLATMLSMYVSTNQKDWDTFVPLVTFAYNTAPQETTKETPFFLIYGRSARLPIDIALGVNSTEENVQETLEKLSKTRKEVLKQIESEQLRQKNKYDVGRRHVEYKVGEKVMVYTPIRKVGKSEKLLHRWFGPYEIVEKISDLNYKLKIKKGKKFVIDTIHVERLKNYYERV